MQGPRHPELRLGKTLRNFLGTRVVAKAVMRFPLLKKDNLDLAKATWREFVQADCFNLAASLSYYTVFSLVPMLTVIIAVSSWFLGRDAVTGALFGQINGLVGKDTAESLQNLIANAYAPRESFIAAMVGLATLVFGSTGVFAQLQNALNRVWNVKAQPHEKRQWLKQIYRRSLSFGMVLAVVFMLLVSLAVNAIFSAFWTYIAALAPGVSEILLKISEIVLSISFTSFLFMLMFKFLPDIQIRWRDVARGGVLTAILFEVGKNLIGLYLGRSHVASAYGGAATIVIVMLWMNYSALIFFFGASFTKAFTLRHGQPVEPESYAKAI